jgi:hypothetical protein
VGEQSNQDNRDCMAQVTDINMRIVFEPSTLHVSKSGSVTAVVYFDFGAKQYFPVAGWNDFVVVLGTWWLAALGQLARTGEETALHFMDGPYWITVVAQQGSKVLLRCTEDRQMAAVAQPQTLDAGEFEREVIGFARAVSAACDVARIESTDLDNLRRLLPS